MFTRRNAPAKMATSSMISNDVSQVTPLLPAHTLPFYRMNT